MMLKTNALRILESAGVRHYIHEYDASDGKIDGASVAVKIRRHPETVYKTLVTDSKTTGLNIFVIPVLYELDLKKAAFAANDKYIKMIKSRNLQYLGADYFLKFKLLLTPSDIPNIQKLIVTKSWWDTVDSLDTLVGVVALHYPEINGTILAWSVDENSWLRRVAIDHQLLRKRKPIRFCLSGFS